MTSNTTPGATRIVDLSSISTVANDDLLIIFDSSDNSAAKNTTVSKITNTIQVATESSNGLMSSSDKIILNSLSSVSSGVDSFNSRTGLVVPVSGDYSSNQISNDTSLSGNNLTDVIQTINSSVSALNSQVSAKFDTSRFGTFGLTLASAETLTSAQTLLGITSGGGGSTTLSGLTDVNISSPLDNDYLIYDSGTSKWVNNGTINTTITNIQTSISANNTVITALSSSVSSLNTTATNLQTNINTVSAGVSANNTSITALNSSVSSLNTSVTTLAASVSSNNIRITNLNASVSSLNTSVTLLTTSVSSLSTTTASNTSSITTLQASVSSNNTVITTLQASVSANNTAITNIQSSVSAINTSITNITASVSAKFDTARFGTFGLTLASAGVVTSAQTLLGITTYGAKIVSAASTVSAHSILGYPSSTTDLTLPKFTGTEGNMTTTGITVGSNNEISGYIGNILTRTSVTSHVVSSSDAGKILVFDNSTTVSVGLPNNLPIGFAITIIQQGAGQVQVSAQTGATLNERQSHTKTTGQYATVGLVVKANSGGSAAIWNMSGDSV